MLLGEWKPAEPEPVDLTCYIEIGRMPRDYHYSYMSAVVVQEACPVRCLPLTVVHNVTIFNKTLEQIGEELVKVYTQTKVKRFVLESGPDMGQVADFLRWRFGVGFKFALVGHAR